MEFKEAMVHLRNHRKITRNVWACEYLEMDVMGKIKGYREEWAPFNFVIDIITSTDWVIEGEEDTMLSFEDILKPLKEGKSVKLKEWPKHCAIEIEKTLNSVFIRKICDFDFTPSFNCFLANDWMVIEEESVDAHRGLEIEDEKVMRLK